jgi:adenylosuccinate lyase
MTTIPPSLSPLDDRYRSQISPLIERFCEQGLMKERLTVEIFWLKALAACTEFAELAPLHKNAKLILSQTIEQFDTDAYLAIKKHEDNCRHDVKAVEYYLKDQLNQYKETQHLVEFVHFGCTSEDINNCAYGRLIQQALNQVLLPSLHEFQNQLAAMASSHSRTAMLSRTHGQAASPTTVGKEVVNVLARLKRPVSQLRELPIMGKFNGAVGNFNAHAIALPGIDWIKLSKTFIETLGLKPNLYTTQIEPHDWIAEMSLIFVRINQILLDFAQDTWHYISLGYFKQSSKKNEVGSSTMPHKVNPIDFENAEGNIGLANSLWSHFASKLTVSRWQRDLSDSTVMRNIGVAFGHTHLALMSLLKGLKKISPCDRQLSEDLSQNWPVITEAIQTCMRLEGLPTPYEQLKNLSRGERVDESELRSFIQQSGLSTESQERLMSLTPALYVGLAEQLTHQFLDELNA